MDDLIKKLTEILDKLVEMAPDAVALCADIAQINAAGRLLEAGLWAILAAVLYVTLTRKTLPYFLLAIRESDRDYEYDTGNKRVIHQDKTICEVFSMLSGILAAVFVMFIGIGASIVFTTVANVWVWIGVTQPELACVKNLVDQVAK